MGKLLNENQKLIFIDSEFKRWVIEILDPIRFNQKRIISQFTNVKDKINESVTDDQFNSMMKSKYRKSVAEVLSKNKITVNEDILDDFIDSPIFEYYSRTFTPVIIRCKVINKSIKLYLSFRYYIKTNEFIDFKLDLGKTDNYSELIVSDSVIDELVNEGIILKYNKLLNVSIEFPIQLSEESEFELDKLFTSLSGIQLNQGNFKSVDGSIYSYELNPYHMKLKFNQVFKNTGYWLYTHYDEGTDFKEFLSSSLRELFNNSLYELSVRSNSGEVNKIHVTQYQFNNLLSNLNDYIRNMIRYVFGPCNITFTDITEKF